MSKKRNSALWHIHDPRHNRDHYLMGTMHVKSLSAYAHVRPAEALISTCDIYAGEMNLELAANANLNQYFQLTEGDHLKDYLTKAQYAKLATVLSDVSGIDVDHVNNLNPLAIVNIISESWLQEDFGLSLDQHLWNYAHKQEKVLTGLESVEDQINILKAIPIKYQLITLKQLIRNVSKYRNSIVSLAQLYSDGNMHALYKKSKKSLGMIKHLMLRDRNKRMVEKFVDYATQSTTFAAVGAAHLSGRHGMLHLFNEKGFQISPVEIINKSLSQ